MREGYDIGEVEEFLDQARAALGRARPAGLQAVGG